MPNRIEVFEQPISVTTAAILPSMVVPFSTGTSTTTTVYVPGNRSGSTVAACGFGKNGAYPLGYEADFTTRTFTLMSNGNYAFAVASDISSVSIYGEFLSSIALSNSYNISPYVALAVANSWSSTFSILPETIIPLATETNFIANTLYSNNNEKIPVSIPAGSKVAIVCGHTNDSASTTSTISTSYFSGGIAMW